MKKAKIMLTAIIVLAVAGAIAAFNIKSFSPFCYYSSTESHNGVNGDYCFYNVGVGTIITTTPDSPQTYATTIEKLPGQSCAIDIQISCPELVSTIELGGIMENLY
jgi:hypothetical protein